MADPFESLRHDAEGKGSTAIDPRFRADLLAEARRRLSSEASTESIRPRVPADTPTPIPMEPIPMLAKNPKKTRPILLAAACVALVAAGIITVAALRSDDDKPPATTDTTPVPTLETTPTQTEPSSPETTQPGTTAASSSPASEPPADDDIAHEILLPSEGYAPRWFMTTTTSWGVGFDAAVARRVPECAPYTSSVFDALSEAPHDTRMWALQSPAALWPQHVVVLPDAATAREIFDVVHSSEFSPCADAYNWAQTDAGQFPLPIAFDRPMSEPPGGAVGDISSYRRYGFAYLDDAGGTHEDVALEVAIVIDRALIFVGTLNSENGTEVVSEAQFHDTLERAVDHAATTLNVSVPESSATASTLPPLADAAIAHAMMLTEQEYGDWDVQPAGSGLDATMDAEIAGTLDACTVFLESVFDRVDPESTSVQLFHHVDPQALFSQYVVVFPDASTARDVYEIVNSPEFVPCATAYGTAITPGAANQPGQANRALPSPVQQPISTPPFPPIGDAMTYRTFVENYRGPQTDLDAVMLVDRTITFIGTVTDGEGGAVLNTVDQFESALRRVAERANSALAGNNNP